MKFTVFQVQHNGSKFPITSVESDSYTIHPGRHLTKIEFHISEENARNYPVIGRVASLSVAGSATDVSVKTVT